MKKLFSPLFLLCLFLGSCLQETWAAIPQMAQITHDYWRARLTPCENGPQSLHIRVFDWTSQPNQVASSFPYEITPDLTTPAELGGLKGNCILENSRYALLSDDLFFKILFQPISDSAIFTPDAPQFQQINSFYFSTKLHDYVTNTLGASLLDPVAIVPHCDSIDKATGDNLGAFYLAEQRYLCFGWITNKVGKKIWAADDSSVIIHEAGHSINTDLASVNILRNSPEAIAIDEGVADYWAATMLNVSNVAAFYLSADGSPIRSANDNHSYPISQDFESHDDGRMITEVLWELRKGDNLGKAITDGLVKRSLQLLSAHTSFADFYEAIYEASGPNFLNLTHAQRAIIVEKFKAKGIHRVDSASGIRLAEKNGVTVVDGTAYLGNCDGQLNVGESVPVLVNLDNTNPYVVGGGTATLGPLPEGLVYSNNRKVAEYTRILPKSNFRDSVQGTLEVGGQLFFRSFFWLKATSPGVKDFTLIYKPMYSDPTGASVRGPDLEIKFSLTVQPESKVSFCQ